MHVRYCWYDLRRPIGERLSLGSMQQCPQVYFQVARVGAEGLFGGAFAKSISLEVTQELLA